MLPLISVIIPVYKVEKYLSECVDSVINQTYENLEIILVDDGSPDKCPRLCDDYAERDSRIKVLHKDNGGLASARNAGLDICTGELVSFVDSDDIIDSPMYKKMVDFLLEKKLDIVCCAGVKFKDEDFFEKCFHDYGDYSVFSGDEITREMLKDKIGSQAVKGLYKRRCWDGVRFPPGRLYEDVPTTYKAFFAAETVGFVADEFYKYRCNDYGISHTPNPMKTYHIFLGFKDHFLFALEHYPEIAKDCCSNAANYAVSTYFHYCSDSADIPKECVEDAYSFLKDNKEYIDYSKMMKTRAYTLKILNFSRPVFKVMCKLLCVTGLQKKLNLQVK